MAGSAQSFAPRVFTWGVVLVMKPSGRVGGFLVLFITAQYFSDHVWFVNGPSWGLEVAAGLLLSQLIA